MTLILDLVQEKWKEQKRPKKFQNEKKKLLDSTHYLIRHFLSKGNLENGGTFLQKSFVEKCFKWNTLAHVKRSVKYEIQLTSG